MNWQERDQSMTLANRVAIISGSGRGIGREIARLFSSVGASIVVADIDAESARSAASEINAAGHVARAIAVDIGDPAQVERLVGDTLAQFGRLDVLVNNAGVGLNKPFLATTPAEWEQQLRVNLTGTFLCARAAAEVMTRQRAGTIVNMASISGQRGGQGRAAYGAAKAGVILLTKVMAVELAPLGASAWAIQGLALGVAALLAGTQTLWFQSGIAKGGIYSLNLALTLATLWALLKVRAAGLACDLAQLRGGSGRGLSCGCPAPGALALAGLCFGLGMAHHWTSQVVLVPGLLWLLAEPRWRRDAWPDAKGALRIALVPAALFLAGLALYLYLPQGSSRPLRLRWGEHDCWSGSW